MIVRISRGTFDPARADVIDAALRDSAVSLASALARMVGLLRYETGIEAGRGAMIAVSAWDTAEHAAALSGLPEMNAMRPIFQELGITFEPITSYEIAWDVGPLAGE